MQNLEPLDIDHPDAPDAFLADLRAVAAALNADAGNAGFRRQYTLKEIVIQADWLRTSAMIALNRGGYVA